MVYFAAFVVFVLAVVGMAVGVLLGNRELSGSCGGVGSDGHELGDCLCARKDNDLCTSDAGNELVALAEMGYPKRRLKNHPASEERGGDGALQV